MYLNECRQLGIPVLVPDVNESDSDFAVRRTAAIRFGHVGGAQRRRGRRRAHRRGARDEGGPFTDFFDFCERVDPQALNKRTIESLIKAGGVRLARASRARACSTSTSRSSTTRSPAGASGTPGS